MSPVDGLLREHELSRRMLSLLERIAARVELGIVFPHEHVAQVLSFFREFLEAVHQAKEDLWVYPLAVAHCEDRVAELVGQLIGDHEGTKELIHTLTLFWEPGDLLEDERAGFCGLARAYTARLRRHMTHEELGLFQCVDRLTDAERDHVLQQFAEIERGRRSFDEWRAVAESLEAVYPA